MSSVPPITYRANSWILPRFIDHCRFATSRDTGIDRSSNPNLAPNLCEKIGDAGLWVVEEMPKKVWNLATNPRFVSIALTVLALGAVSLAFYPVTTVLAVKAGIALLPTVPYWAVKFGAYLLTCHTVLSYGARAIGRTWNQDLLNAFYATAPRSRSVGTA